jgi:hypothetical protein
MKMYKNLIASALLLLGCAGAHAADSKWITVTADNGAIYKIDVGQMPYRGMPPVIVQVWAMEGGGARPTGVIFQCNGYFNTMTDYGSAPAQYAPPRSVAGQIEKIVCTKP